MVTAPRIVLDTNCVVSALLFAGGRLAWLRAAWQEGRIVTLADRDTAAELLRVLRYPKFRLSEAEQESLLADYLPYAESIPSNMEPIDHPELRDPDDLKFIVLAIRAKAEALVSGDADILDVRTRLTNTTVLTPAEFHDWLIERTAETA